MALAQFVAWTVASGLWGAGVLRRTGSLSLSVAAGAVFFMSCSLTYGYLS